MKAYEKITINKNSRTTLNRLRNIIRKNKYRKDLCMVRMHTVWFSLFIWLMAAWKNPSHGHICCIKFWNASGFLQSGCLQWLEKYMHLNIVVQIKWKTSRLLLYLYLFSLMKNITAVLYTLDLITISCILISLPEIQWTFNQVLVSSLNSMVGSHCWLIQPDLLY